MAVRKGLLQSILSWLAVALILRVTVTIVCNYPDYFPPNYDSLFLQGREHTFHGLYRMAFTIHIVSAPVVLLNGLLLISERLTWHWHRILGRLQVIVLLLLVVPSSVIMSRQAFGGWGAGLSFLLLSLSTGGCAILGLRAIYRRRVAGHRLWMRRCYLLLCSAIFLRLISGAASLLEVSDAEGAYILAAWCSWLVPLGLFELVRSRGSLR